jgi:hypothetical protein
MLENVDKSEEHESIISWLPHGKAFRVHKPTEFASDVMGRYFKQSKYKSFQRQLHIYGFRRIDSKEKTDYGAYYHTQFLRGQQNMSLTMTITTIKGTYTGSGGSQHVDPNFYREEAQVNAAQRGGHETTSANKVPMNTTSKPRRSAAPAASLCTWFDTPKLAPTVLNSMESKNAIFSSRRRSRKQYSGSVQPILSSGNENGVELFSSVRMQLCGADKEWPLRNYRSCDVQDETGSDGEEDDPLFFEGKQFFFVDGDPYHGVENFAIVETYTNTNWRHPYKFWTEYPGPR